MYLSAYQDCTHFFFHCSTALVGPGLLICEASWSHSWPTRTHTNTHTHTHTLSMTPLDEWSARRRALYLTSHNTHNRETSRPLAALEPVIPASERSHTYALYRAATGLGTTYPQLGLIVLFFLARQPQWARASSFTRFLDHTTPHHSR